MRTFYVFKINNMFQTFYNDKSSILFKMFNEIYNSKDDDLINSFIKDIIDSKENVFVIDFKNKDYFWLNQINYEPLV